MFEEEGFSDIEKAAFERSLSAPSVQGYSFNHSEESGGNSFGNKDFFHTGVNSGIPRPERAATSDNFESSEFRNSFIFDDNNLEKFDNFESSRLKSLIINEDSDMESPLDLIQKDFPSTPSDIFGHKSVTVDDSQSQENSSTGHSSPPREKTTSSSSILDQDNSEVKDELADVLDDIDQCMYVTEPNSSESNSTEASNNQQSNLVSNNFQQQQYPPNQQPTSYPQYSGQQPSQQGFQIEGRNQPNQQYSNYPQEFGYHSQQMQFQQQSQGHSQNFQQHQNQGHSYNRPESDSSTLQSQQQQLQQGLQMPNGYNVTGRGQTVAGNPMPLQHNVYDLGNGQSAMVGGTVPGVALGIDHQSPYFVNVMPNGPQQPVYIDPYFQSRMGMPNSGAFPQVQTSGSGEGMGFVQFGHIAQPNGVGSYWPHGAVINSDTGVPQNALLMQQPGQQGPGVYLQHDPNQFNPAAAQVGQQPMNVFPMAMGSRSNLGNHGYPQQNIQGHFGPQSPVRASGIQGSLSPSKPVPQGSQSVGHENANDTFRQDNGGVDVMGNDANGSLNRLSDRRFASRSNSAAGRGSPTGSGSGANNNSSSASRDAVVEDFRNTYGKGRQWEIQDLVGHVVAFCQDQHGSRFIQQRLEVANDADKQIVFDEVLPSAHSLMTDVFGNYVIQKLFEFGTPDQCETLAALLMGQAVPLALQMYGCRVIQKALEYVATERLVALVGEFEGKEVLRCVHDQNGNHVIQKCIEVVSKVAKESAADTTDYLSSRIQFIIQAFSGRVRELSMHPYGCRVVQRILEHCSNTQKAPVLEELRKCCRELIQDQYGNYVIQHVMQHGWETDKAILIDEVQSRLLEYSQHKFASNVVEKCIQYASKKDRDQMIWTIINVTFDLNNPVDAKTGQCVLENMVRDPYANYVVQKVIDVSDASQRGAIIRYMRENIVQLRRYTYGKHIIIRLEKVSGEKF